MCLPKESVPAPPKGKAPLPARWNLMLGNFLGGHPCRYTFLCIAGRSLSRMRGSPLGGVCVWGRRLARVRFIVPLRAAAALPPDAAWVWCELVWMRGVRPLW